MVTWSLVARLTLIMVLVLLVLLVNTPDEQDDAPEPKLKPKPKSKPTSANSSLPSGAYCELPLVEKNGECQLLCPPEYMKKNPQAICRGIIGGYSVPMVNDTCPSGTLKQKIPPNKTVCRYEKKECPKGYKLEKDGVCLSECPVGYTSKEKISDNYGFFGICEKENSGKKCPPSMTEFPFVVDGRNACQTLPKYNPSQKTNPKRTFCESGWTTFSKGRCEKTTGKKSIVKFASVECNEGDFKNKTGTTCYKCGQGEIYSDAGCAVCPTGTEFKHGACLKYI